jgi:hypothetical protein
MQNFGGAILLAIAETVFDQELTSGLSTYAPDVNATLVKAAGAAGFRRVVQPAQLGGVLSAYNSTLTKEFYLAIVGGAATIVVCWGMGWTNVAKAKEDTTSGDRQLEAGKESE